MATAHLIFCFKTPRVGGNYEVHSLMYFDSKQFIQGEKLYVL